MIVCNRPPCSRSDRLRARAARWQGQKIAAGLLLLLLAPFAAAAATRDLSAEEAASASLEELMGIQVTTVAGEEEDWFQSPAALSVVTSEDLRRTGHRTLAEFLRVMPGVFVGQIGASRWTVGMRGFSGGLANKTLVLIDGRAVYDPLFGGTLWDVQDILLADLDRIEVIRGPGATLWGANAVNGVINVITKHSADTQGAYARVGAGNEEKVFVSARYGGKIGERGSYRVWGKYADHDHYRTITGDSAHDSWDLGRGGFRFDYDSEGGIDYTLQGDIYNLGSIGEQVTVPVADAHLESFTEINTGWANGGNVLFRASDHTSATAGWAFQAYYDRTSRTQASNFHVERDTADLDFRHHFHLGKIQELHWGFGYRYSADDTRASELISLDPESRDLHTYSGFVQDTFTLLPDRLFAMIGTKLEHNSFTGFEVQPSGRLWWTPDDRNTLWAAISRPVRVPTRIEQDGFLTLGIADTGLLSGQPATGVFAPIGVGGNPDAKSEKLIAYEIGYRRKLTDRLWIDVAPFYNDYSRLLFLPTTIFGTWSNAGSGESYGIEVSSIWRPLDRWTLSGSYSWVDLQIHGDLNKADEGSFPEHLVKLLSHFNLLDNLELNTAVYFSDELTAVSVPSHLRLDQGIVWRATDYLDLSLWGQNLLDGTHREASETIQVQRAFYVEASVHF